MNLPETTAAATAATRAIDLHYWQKPPGVAVPDDELNFLMLPDAVMAVACFTLAKRVQDYQRAHHGAPAQVTNALMVTMGGLLPGVILHDHLVEGQPQDTAPIAFGSVGLKLYRGPGERMKDPFVHKDYTMDVDGRTVLVLDDIGDGGGTLEFLRAHLQSRGAAKILNLAVYVKPQALQAVNIDFYFGETAQDTWIITPRSRVETLVKRVPVWKSRGASRDECARRLELIGYPKDEIAYYLPQAFAAKMAA